MKGIRKTYSLAQWQKALKRLEMAARGEALRRSALAGGFVIEAEAKINVERTFHPSTGNLAGSINTAVVESSSERCEVATGPSVIYGRIQELGGTVVPRNKKWLFWESNGEKHFAKKVTLPARPYLRPAVDENEEKIFETVGKNLAREIEAALGG